jgi:hypothetical protein
MPNCQPDATPAECRELIRAFGDARAQAHILSLGYMVNPVAGSARWRYDAVREKVMIELTEQQADALAHAEATPPRVVNPRTKEVFVLLRTEEYHRLKEVEYDDDPWTREELQALAAEVAERTGWDEYDDGPEQS